MRTILHLNTITGDLCKSLDSTANDVNEAENQGEIRGLEWPK